MALEELEVPYSVRHLDLAKGEQKEDWYLGICPNGRIPAIGRRAGVLGRGEVCVSCGGGGVVVCMCGGVGRCGGQSMDE